LALVLITTFLYGTLNDENSESDDMKDNLLMSEHEEFVHPNLEETLQKTKRSKNPPSRVKVWLKNFDTHVMKRIFRYKYDPNESN
jgi:hypothetical protein